MAKQKLGQNFLHDKNIAGRIAGLVSGTKKIILEIGPGKGIITEILSVSAEAERIIAVEKDTGLYDNLVSRELSKVELLNGDILKIDPSDLSGESKITLIGNIPYYISKEIIDWIINGNKFIEEGVMMVQKEFFQKISAEPGTKIYNAQTIMFGTLFDIKKEFEVRPGAFSPPPKVTSTVFSFKRGQTPFGGEITGLYKMLKTAFLHRRKTLINNLGKHYDKVLIKQFLETDNLPENIRAEDMTPDNFIKLYSCLTKGR
ncbi:MAG: 16S rRNA (adenine(1518)-N(6)/adenine(1519)-N(6))-dimethyltransferase RsmA [Acidobacteriota bacterium]